MSAVEAEGSTLEEAVAAALTQLQADREQVEIEILAQASKGFLGIGGRKARVRATLRNPVSLQEPESPTSTDQSPRERGESGAPARSFWRTGRPARSPFQGDRRKCLSDTLRDPAPHGRGGPGLTRCPRAGSRYQS